MYLSWLESTTDNREVVGSSPTIPIPLYEEPLWAYNSVGRVSDLHSDCRRFESVYAHLGSVAESGLLQNPAKIPCQVIGTTGSNPVTSA